ncbi:hypothetical protein MTR67_048399 [Solanum verrucosum]|uniref:Integrase zinc-binding domain-containing protein n=1 Tax=Solanum verrucosum TaxID=315347 RepID=A0AAF0V0J1_SOLVR|nr:hypothetical protein MTR67_048399 [Solanum verrucosum]
MSEACEKSFQEWNDRFTFALVLTLPEETAGFVVYYDASRIWLGCVLMQNGKVIAYVSRWLELLKDYDMSVLYHPNKVNVVANALSELYMGSVAHIEEAKQDLDPILVDLKEEVLKKSVDEFSQGGDGVLRYQGRLCVLNVDDLREQLMSEAHNSRYSIHPGTTKMSRDLREVYWWNGMKKYIAEFVTKCPNCQQVKVDHQKLGGLSQDNNIATWKWEDLNMDFIVGLPRTQRQHDSIWVIVDWMTKSDHFIPVKGFLFDGGLC